MNIQVPIDTTDNKKTAASLSRAIATLMLIRAAFDGSAPTTAAPGKPAAGKTKPAPAPSASEDDTVETSDDYDFNTAEDEVGLEEGETAEEGGEDDGTGVDEYTVEEEPAPAKPAATKPKPAATAPKLTLKEVMAECQAVDKKIQAKTKGTAEVKAKAARGKISTLLKEFKAKSTKDLKPAVYGDFVKKLKALAA